MKSVEMLYRWIRSLWVWVWTWRKSHRNYASMLLSWCLSVQKESLSSAWRSSNDVFREIPVCDFREFHLSYTALIPLYYKYISPTSSKCWLIIIFYLHSILWRSNNNFTYWDQSNTNWEKHQNYIIQNTHFWNIIRNILSQ